MIALEDFLVSFLEILQVHLDMDRMLQESLELLVERFGFLGGMLAVVDPYRPRAYRTGEIWREIRGEAPLDLDEEESFARLAGMCSTLTGAVTLEEFLGSSPVGREELAVIHGRRAFGFGERMVLIPLRDGDRVIGLIKLVGSEETPELCGERRAFLDLVGRKMGREISRELTLRRERKLQEERDMLRRLGGFITSELDLEKALDGVIRMSTQALDIKGCTVFVPDKETGRVAVAHSLNPRDPKVAFAIENQPELGFMGEAAHKVFVEGVAVYVEDARDDPRANAEFAREHDIRGGAGIPIVYQGEVLAGMLIEEPDDRRFTPDDIRVMQGIADFAAVAIANARLYRESQEQRERSGELMRRLARVQEEERARISRELHDSMASTLLEIIYRAEALLSREGDEHLRGELQSMLQSSRSTLAELRRIITDLRPSSVEVLGLPRALAALLDRVAAAYGLRMERDIEEDLPLDSLLENSLYRLAQEALNNICRHSGASRVEVSLRRRDGSLLLRISDDGRGFDPASPSRGFGLGFMRERAELLGGSLSVSSAPGRGTTLVLEAPLTRGEADGGMGDEIGQA